MRYFILVLFCIFNFTASAQFWQSSPKAPRIPLPETKAYAYIGLPVITANAPVINNVELLLAHVVNVDLVEESILKEAKHNMRFRIYNLASYNFSDLANLYVKQSRFSEAKWYLLQSNTLSRQQNDTKHTLSNLLALAKIKAEIGEFTLAKTDLQEAHDIATANGLLADVTEINKRIHVLNTSKPSAIKTGTRYAEAVEIANSKPPIN